MSERLQGVLDRLPKAKVKATKKATKKPKPKPKPKKIKKTERPSWHTVRSSKHMSETPVSDMKLADIAAIMKGSSVILQELSKQMTPDLQRDVSWIAERLETVSVRAYELSNPHRQDYRKQKS